MPTTSRGARSSLALLAAGSLGLATLATGLTLVAAPAQAASPDLVISEVYGGGGNTGATYTHDYVEIDNLSLAPVSLDGITLQYRSAANTGTAGSVVDLSAAGQVAPGGHLVVRLGTQDAGVGAPTPADHVGSALNISGANGQVFLARATSGIDPDGAGNSTITDAAVLDFVGYGTAAVKEGGTAAPSAADNASSIARDAASTDTDVNGADFTSGAPTPGEPSPSGEVPDPEPVAATIPEIQGAGATSPLVGQEVRTSGVVTAVPRLLYGFYLQTPGSGATVGEASDGLFVYFPQGSGAITVRPGDHVRVAGRVSEFAGATQVESSEAEVEQLATPAEPVTAYAGEWPATDAAKESLEGMLVDVTDQRFTVTDTYSTNRYGEVGLALGDRPLVQPTEVADAQDLARIAAVEADNAARAIVLDDGSSTDYTRNQSLTPPYVSHTAPVRVGARATFTEPVVLTQGGSPSSPTYRFQPTTSVSGPDYQATSPAVFEDTRTAAPEPVGGDVSVASFNVLNYFTTLGDADDDNVGDGGCLAYTDRDGDGNNVRGGCPQRGAWDPQDLARQQAKIVAAINALDADVVGLMEIENSAVLGEEPDEATRALVAALNAAAGEEKWAANPSSTELPPTSEQDVISNAIIYQPAAVERVGEARALGDQSAAGQAFDNAREPLAQVFRPVGGGTDFLFVVNHFKSKGSGIDDGTGQGNANPDRVAQARALAAWVPGVADDTGTEAVLLAGDFNAYSMEDPLQELSAAGYTDTETASDDAEWSYSFSGRSGSLDHVLANDAAMGAVTGVDIWNINSGESLAMEYSRFDYHGTDFHRADPYRSSDHDPVKVGLDLVADEPEGAPSTTTLQVRPREPRAGKSVLVLRVVVDSEAAVPTGTVTVRAGGESVSGELDRRGRVVLRLRNPFTAAGEETVAASYAGDGTVAPSEQSVTVTVRG